MEFLHSKELEEFYENYDKLHPGEVSARCRNIYDIKAVDMDGNVVDQKFGLNLMTDFGFQRAYKYGDWNYSDNYYRIWIGDGTEYPKYNNNALYGRFTSSSPQGSVGRHSDFDGMRYDKNTKMCSIKRKAQYGYYDYNLSDLNGNTITEDKYIREIGIGYAWNELRMHAKIYDKDGEESSITKKPNQRLYITTYITTTMDPSYITEAYNNGEYIAVDMRHATRISADDIVDSTHLVMGFTPIHSQYALSTFGSWVAEKPFVGYNNRDGSWNIYDETSHTITYNSPTQYGGGVIEGKYQYVSEEQVITCDRLKDIDYDNCRVRDGSAIAFRFVNCEEPEDLENVTTFTNGRTSGNLSNSFGMPYVNVKSRGRVPVTDADVHKVTMYNHSTKEWDIEEEFVNNPELQLYDYWMARYTNVWIYVTFLNSNKLAYVFINPHIDRPILSFAQSGFTLYATDEYWNTDSWEPIGNIKSVPEELRCKRYYISLSDPRRWAKMSSSTWDYGYLANGQGLITTRDITTHKIIPVSQYKTYTLPYTAPYNNSRITSNNELGYIAYPNCLFYPDAINPETELPYAYKLTDESGANIDDGYIFGFGKKIFVMGRTEGRTGTSKSTINGQTFTYPDDRVVLSPETYYYYPNQFGGEAIGFRVYTIGDTPSEAPTYENFKFPTIRYNPTRWAWAYGGLGGWGAGFHKDDRDNYFIRYEQPHPSISTNGFIVLSTLHPGLNTSYPFPTIINLYGGEDGNTVEIDELKDYKMGMAVAMTDYVCLMNKNTSVPYQYELYNVKTKEVDQTFEFESGYTVMGYAGWKNYIYFLTNYNSERRSFVYHIDTQTLEYCPNETFWFLNNLQRSAADTSKYVHYDNYRSDSVEYSSSKFTINSVSNDEVVIFSSNVEEGDWRDTPAYHREYGQCYFTSYNPTHRQYVLPSMENYDGFTTYHSNGDLKYINNEDKQLIYVSGSQNRIVVQDMGLQIDKPTGFDVDFYPKYEMPWYENQTVPSNCIFKDRIFLIKPKTGVVQELPIEYCIRHKLDVSTHTITSFNNPVRVSASNGFTWSVTNRVDPKGE